VAKRFAIDVGGVVEYAVVNVLTMEHLFLFINSIIAGGRRFVEGLNCGRARM